MNNNAWAQYNLMVDADSHLRSQLTVAAATPDLWMPLTHELFGMGQRTAWDLLKHLHDTYGTYDEMQRQELREKLNAPWNGASIVPLIAQIDNYSEQLVAAGETIHDRLKCDTLFHLVLKSGGQERCGS